MQNFIALFFIALSLFSWAGSAGIILGLYLPVWANLSIRLTSRGSRIATAPFFEHFLLAKLMYNVTYRAHPQSAKLRALDGLPNVVADSGR